MTKRLLFFLLWPALAWGTADQVEYLFVDSTISEVGAYTVVGASDYHLALDEYGIQAGEPNTPYVDIRDYIDESTTANDTLVLRMSNLFSTSAVGTVDSIVLAITGYENFTGDAILEVHFDTSGTFVTGNTITMTGTTPTKYSVNLGGGWTTTQINALKIRLVVVGNERSRVYTLHGEVWHTRTSAAPSITAFHVPDSIRGATQMYAWVVGITAGSGWCDSVVVALKETGSSQWVTIGSRVPPNRYRDVVAGLASDFFSDGTEDSLSVPCYIENYNETCSLRVILAHSDGSFYQQTPRFYADTAYADIIVREAEVQLVDTILLDTYIDSIAPTTNSGAVSNVLTQVAPSAAMQRILAQLASVPDYGDSSRYFIRWKTYSTAAKAGMSMRVLRVTEAWNETEVTYNDRVTGTPWTDAGGTFDTECDSAAFGDSGSNARAYGYVDVTIAVQSGALNVCLDALSFVFQAASAENGVDATWMPTLWWAGIPSEVTDKGDYRSRAADVGWRSKAGQVGAR